jgi:MFS family permease
MAMKKTRINRMGTMSSSTAIPASSGVGIDQDDTDLARTTMRRVSLHLLPFLLVLYICNYLDRTNVAIAALQMNRDLSFSASAYGFGAGIFFLGYALFEVPSNLVLARVGARRWIARIMITWGLVAAAMMFVRTPIHFYTLRFLLGVAEAGFFPGIVYYLSGWFPAVHRARALSRFMTAIPISVAIGNPLGAWLLGLDGMRGLAGWQWLFLLEGIPSVVLGFAVLPPRLPRCRALALRRAARLACRTPAARRRRIARTRRRPAAPRPSAPGGLAGVAAVFSRHNDQLRLRFLGADRDP